MVDYLAIDDFVPLDVQNMLSYQGKKVFMQSILIMEPLTVFLK